MYKKSSNNNNNNNTSWSLILIIIRVYTRADDEGDGGVQVFEIFPSWPKSVCAASVVSSAAEGWHSVCRVIIIYK